MIFALVVAFWIHVVIFAVYHYRKTPLIREWIEFFQEDVSNSAIDACFGFYDCCVFLYTAVEPKPERQYTASTETGRTCGIVTAFLSAILAGLVVVIACGYSLYYSYTL
jgi:hypothetical protein